MLREKRETLWFEEKEGDLFPWLRAAERKEGAAHRKKVGEKTVPVFRRRGVG